MDYTCAISGMAWVGFTSATGDAFSVHKVESWKFLNLGQDGALTSFGPSISRPHLSDPPIQLHECAQFAAQLLVDLT